MNTKKKNDSQAHADEIRPPVHQSDPLLRPDAADDELAVAELEFPGVWDDWDGFEVEEERFGYWLRVRTRPPSSD